MSTKSKKRREAKGKTYQARREQHLLKNNNVWADCDNLYQQCVQLLALPAHLSVIANEPDVITNMEDMSVFAERCQQLANDTISLSQKLKAIHDQHASEAGSAKGTDQFILAIKIYEQYIQFMEVHSAVCKPVFEEIMEMISRAGVIAANKKTEKQAEEVQSQAQDPNHTDPIDVIVKEA